MRGSISAAGGGQTLSWNMEPDSEARARSRRGGKNGDEGGGDKGPGKGMACVRATIPRTANAMNVNWRTTTANTNSAAAKATSCTAIAMRVVGREWVRLV